MASAEVIAKKLEKQFPGIRVTSKRRSRAEQDALVRAGKTRARNSQHVDGTALDIVLPDGVNPGQVRSYLSGIGVEPGEFINESGRGRNQGTGAHLHIGLAPKRNAPAQRPTRQRASSGESTFDRVRAKRAEQEDRGPSISKVYEAYKSGRMEPREAAQFENDILEGRVMLPRGAALKKKPPVFALPANVVKAYNSHEMSDEDRAEIDRDLRAGVVSLPRGATLKRPEARGVGETIAMGVRPMLEQVGSIVDIAAAPIAALGNALPGEQGLSTSPFRDAATEAGDMIGLSTPESSQEKLLGSLIEGATGGLLTAGGGILMSGARGATGTIAKALGAAPVADVAANATAAGAGELARQAGAGPVGQMAASLAGGVGAVSAVGGGQRIAKSLSAAKTADEVAAVVPKETVFDRTGNLTEEGREIVIQRDIAPDDLRAAYDEAPPSVRRSTANEATDVPEARAVNDNVTVREAANDVLPIERVEPAPPIRTVPEETAAPPRDTPEAPEAPAAVAAQPETALARVAEAQSEGVPLTRGQATQDFAIQDAEQTLLADAGRPGAEARTFAVEQADKIKEATERFQSAFGDRTMNATDRGAAIKDAIRELKEEGRKGVQALYKAAAETPGHDIPIVRDAVLEAADKAILETPMDQGSKDALERALAKFGMLGKNVEANGRYRSVITDDGRKIRILGEVEPLTLKNVEAFRQALNAAWDQKGLMGSVIRALDETVDDTLAKTASSERNDLFKQARNAARQQKQTFEAKDIVQNLADWKKGTRTDVVLPERAISQIFSGGKEGLTNLKKIKALLLSSPTEKTRAAWKAIQAQGVGDILGNAYTTNSNLGGGSIGSVSGAKLNTAIEKFGTDKLKVLLDEAEFNQLMKLRRIIGNATIPIKNTTNPSGSAFKLMRFLGPFTSKLAPLAPYGMAARELIDKARAVKQAQETLTGMTEFSATAAAKEGPAPKGKTAAALEAADRAANELIQSLIEIAGSGRLVAPILASAPEEDQ